MASEFSNIVTIDFETEGIKPRPEYPPKPVSLAIRYPSGLTKALAWGHPEGNNCTEEKAKAELEDVFRKYKILGQNMMFDLDVAETHWGLRPPTYDRWHDTMFLLFLLDPHSPTISLKPSAERYLGIKPEEQDLMYEWILANVPEAKKSTAGAYISRCPYAIVEPYHVGDVERTWQLFKFLYPRIVDLGMREAYERELKLMPILLESARRGMPIDTKALRRDLPRMERGIELADEWLRRELGVADLDVDKDRQLGKALYDHDALKEYYRTGKSNQIAVNKAVLTLDRFKDPRIFHVLQYRNSMQTSISMFAKPWLELAGKTGVLHPDWVQVRTSRVGADSNGARSGRIISVRPNFLNIPKKWKKAATAGYAHPAFIGEAMPLPFMRRYCLPLKNQQWGKRDFNQQEIRLFAHFEEGPVARGFKDNKDFDVHELVRAEAERKLTAAGLRSGFDRDTAKTAVFGKIYGQGVTGLMAVLRLRDDEKEVAKKIQDSIKTAVPSIDQLSKMLAKLSTIPVMDEFGRKGEPLRTWGGRLYYCEPPKYSEKFGRDMTFDYKMLNYLIQPSGADVTKETIIRWYEHPQRTAQFLVSVYDELDFSCEKSAMVHEQGILRDAMRSIETDVKMESDGECGSTWGTLEKFYEG